MKNTAHIGIEQSLDRSALIAAIVSTSWWFQIDSQHNFYYKIALSFSHINRAQNQTHVLTQNIHSVQILQRLYWAWILVRATFSGLDATTRRPRGSWCVCVCVQKARHTWAPGIIRDGRRILSASLFATKTIKTQVLSILFSQCERYGPHYSRSVPNSKHCGALNSLYLTILSHICI